MRAEKKKKERQRPLLSSWPVPHSKNACVCPAAQTKAQPHPDALVETNLAHLTRQQHGVAGGATLGGQLGMSAS